MKPYALPTCGLIAGLFSTTWMLLAVLTRLSDAVYFPQSIRYFGGALVLLVLPLITSQRLPKMSLRLLHASLTSAGLAYFLSPVLAIYALRSLPSGFVGVVFCTLPMWLTLIAYTGRSRGWNSYLILILALVAFYFGVRPEAELRSASPVKVFALAGSIFSMLLGVWVSRRLFWLHSALDLNFWSMMLAGAAHLVVGLVHHESGYVAQWPRAYWVTLAILTFGVTGLGSYVYRIERMRPLTVAVMNAGVPLAALAIGFALWGETPHNAVTVPAALVVVGLLGYGAYVGLPSQWMCLALNNDKRQGDRLLCLFDAFVRPLPDGKTVKLQVSNLSVSGVGFRSETELTPGVDVLLSLPLGQSWSSVTLTGRVVHCHPSGHADLPFVGGMEFRQLNEHRQQCVVEFLARLSKAEEEVGTYEDKLARAS